jgi:hypothetical protein
MVNPDGTVQAAPPTMSAFAQQPGVMPGQPVAPPTNYQTGTPGFSGALMDMIKALASSLGPKSITQHKSQLNQQEQQAQGLGNEFNAGR